jgi:hypothetical protein
MKSRQVLRLATHYFPNALKGDQDDPPVEDERHLEHCRKPYRSGEGKDDADEAAE